MTVEWHELRHWTRTNPQFVAAERARAQAAAQGQACTCPRDYATPGGHNEWCPASVYYIGRLHWHDRACYANGDLVRGACVCGKISGLSLKEG